MKPTPTEHRHSPARARTCRPEDVGAPTAGDRGSTCRAGARGRSPRTSPAPTGSVRPGSPPCSGRLRRVSCRRLWPGLAARRLVRVHVYVDLPGNDEDLDLGDQNRQIRPSSRIRARPRGRSCARASDFSRIAITAIPAPESPCEPSLNPAAPRAVLIRGIVARGPVETPGEPPADQRDFLQHLLPHWLASFRLPPPRGRSSTAASVALGCVPRRSPVRPPIAASVSPSGHRGGSVPHRSGTAGLRRAFSASPSAQLPYACARGQRFACRCRFSRASSIGRAARQARDPRDSTGAGSRSETNSAAYSRSVSASSGVCGRREAHGAADADGPPIPSGAFGQPAEERLAQFPVDGLGFGPHLRRLRAPVLRCLKAGRGSVLEPPHAGEVRPKTLVQARQFAFARGARVAPGGFRHLRPQIHHLVLLGVVLHAVERLPLSMVWPRHDARPLAPIRTTLPQPPPRLASAVSDAAWSFVIPPISDNRSTWLDRSCAWTLSDSVTPCACAVPTLTSLECRSTIAVASRGRGCTGHAPLQCRVNSRPSVRDCAARFSWLVASDSESRIPAAGRRLVATPASAIAVPSAATVNAAPSGE